jgi:hypothetical protein
MDSPSLDIFRKDVRGNPVWLDAVANLEIAWLRLSQMASAIPGEYFAFDQSTHKIVVSVSRLGSDRMNSVSPSARMPFSKRWFLSLAGK